MRAKEISADMDPLIEQLQIKVNHPKPTPAYFTGMTLVTLFMIILPLVYLALIAGAIWLTCYHAVHSVVLFELKVSIYTLLIYAAPLIMGSLLVFFMIKPLFAKRSLPEAPVILSPDEQPDFIRYIDALCKNLGAPPPQQIIINSAVNASASFHNGFRGWFRNQLTLTIGAPLISGLTVQQLTGVLAHEFGHFSQGGGMRLTYIIRSISHWFLRVVYERDRIDDWLERTRKQVDFRIAIILHLTDFFIWGSRKILWVLMKLGELISCYMLRQMEYDADLNEILLTGSDNFRECSIQFLRLSIAEEEAQNVLNSSFHEGRMSLDYGDLISRLEKKIKPEHFDEVMEKVNKQQTGSFSTHPGTADRIRHSNHIAATGSFFCKTPATTLLKNYPFISEEVSRSIYKSVFGDDINQVTLCTNEFILEQRSTQQTDYTGLSRFFHDAINLWRPIHLPTALPGESSPEDVIHAHSQWMETKPAYKTALESYIEKNDQLSELACISTLNRCAVPYNKKNSGYTPMPYSQTNEKNKALIAEQKELEPTLKEAEILSGKRLVTVLTLPAKSEDINQQELRDLYKTLHGMFLIIPRFRKLKEQCTRWETLFRANHIRQTQSVYSEAQSNAALINTELEYIKKYLSEYRYPFHHAKGQIMLDELIIPTLPGDNFSDNYNIASAVYQHALEFTARLQGKIGNIAAEILHYHKLDHLLQPKSVDTKQPASSTSPGAPT